MTHMQAARHVLHYLLTTANYSITYGGSDLALHGYANANWGGDRNDRKSTTGYIFFIKMEWYPGPHKQTTAALLTMEAEYMSLSDASREAIARLQLFKDIRTSTDIPTIFSDNQGALTIAMNPTDHQRAKHIDIRYHFIRNCLQKKPHPYRLRSHNFANCRYSHKSSPANTARKKYRISQIY